MLRRAAAASTPRGGGSVPQNTALPLSRRHNNNNKSGNNNHQKLSFDAVLLLLVSAAILLILFTYALPANNNNNQTAVVNRLEHAAAAEMDYLWHEFHDKHAVQPPIPMDKHPQYNNNNNPADEVSTRSAVTGATWVQGEQKLKQALTVLAARQAQGLDIGVPVLTRWVGDDIPAWPSAATMPEPEWKAAVAARYAAMREEEVEWRARMGDYLSHAAARG